MTDADRYGDPMVSQKSRREWLRSIGLVSAVGLTAGCVSGDGGPGINNSCPSGEQSSGAVFSLSHNESSGTVTARLEAGGRTSATDVYLHGDGLNESGTWDALSNAETDGDGNIQSGNTATVSVEDSFRAVLEWGQMQRCSGYVLAELTPE